MVDQGVPVTARHYRVRELVDVAAGDDPPTRPCAHGRLVLGEHRLDGRHAVSGPALAEHLYGRVDGTVKRELFGELGDPLAHLTVKPAALQFAL